MKQQKWTWKNQTNIKEYKKGKHKKVTKEKEIHDQLICSVIKRGWQQFSATKTLKMKI
jgi:hypothetical protein